MYILPEGMTGIQAFEAAGAFHKCLLAIWSWRPCTRAGAISSTFLGIILFHIASFLRPVQSPLGDAGDSAKVVATFVQSVWVSSVEGWRTIENVVVSGISDRRHCDCESFVIVSSFEFGVAYLLLLTAWMCFEILYQRRL